MALLRQCLQELRLRRGETDLLWEGPQPIANNCRVVAAPVGLRLYDDAYVGGAAGRSDNMVLRALRASAADPAWQ
jgi:hypothetical protein